MPIPKLPGTYVLVIQMPERRQVLVGALGACVFEAGWYLYVGSALGGLHQRLARHARAAKREHWHIDYLLAQAQLCEIWYHVGAERLECLWARDLGGASAMVPSTVRLGASDCACRTHLFCTAQRPSVKILACLRPNDSLEVALADDLRDPAQPAKP